MKHGPELVFIPHADPKKIAWSQKRLQDPTAVEGADDSDDDGAADGEEEKRG